MADFEQLHRDETAERMKRRRFAMHLQEIEGNPLDADDVALFERMDREGLTTEQRVAVILEEVRKIAQG